jgi:hypothetical protein
MSWLLKQCRQLPLKIHFLPTFRVATYVKYFYVNYKLRYGALYVSIQGDQSGRIFAHGLVVYFGQFIKITGYYFQGYFLILKGFHPIPWPDSISQPIASSVADGDGTTM